MKLTKKQMERLENAEVIYNGKEDRFGNIFKIYEDEEGYYFIYHKNNDKEEIVDILVSEIEKIKEYGINENVEDYFDEDEVENFIENYDDWTEYISYSFDEIKEKRERPKNSEKVIECLVGYNDNYVDIYKDEKGYFIFYEYLEQDTDGRRLIYEEVIDITEEEYEILDKETENYYVNDGHRTIEVLDFIDEYKNN